MVSEVPRDRWDNVLRARGLGDVYLSSGYLAASAVLDKGVPTLLEVEKRGSGIVFPFLLRAIPGEPELRDVITPYGYGGPVGFGDDPPWDVFHSEYDQWCGERGVVTSFYRFHPLYANQQHTAASTRLESLAGTVGWRIEPGRLFVGMHKKHRRSVRIARDEGVEVVQVDPSASSLAHFRRLYETTMSRVGAESRYHFPDAYWAALLSEVGPKLFLLAAIHAQTEVAAALCFVSPPWMHYHLGASTETGRQLGATTLLLLEAARTGQAMGLTVFHLGGGVAGRSDSLLRFKLRCDPGGLREAVIGKQIHDAETYRRLANSDATDGFFPRYRATG